MKLSLHAHYTSSSEASMNPHAKVARPATESKKAGQHTTNASQAGIDAPRECSRAAADCVASSWSQDAAPGLRCTHDVRHAWRSVLNSRRPARSTRFRNVTTPSPRQRTHRSRPTQALRLPGHRRRLGRHRLGAPRGHARCQSSGLREGRARRHLRQRGLRAEEGHVQRRSYYGVRP